MVARSSAETKFRVLAHRICEDIWIKRILEESKIFVMTPIWIYCDNKVVISIAHNPVLHDRTIHIEVDKHLLNRRLK